MQTLRYRIVLFGFLVLLGLNLLAFLPRWHTSAQHPVGEDAVSVYPYRSEADLRSVPLQDPSTGKALDSGARVHVYLRHAYEDKLNLWYPKATTWILLALGSLYGLFTLIARIMPKRIQKETA